MTCFVVQGHICKYSIQSISGCFFLYNTDLKNYNIFIIIIIIIIITTATTTKIN